MSVSLSVSFSLRHLTYSFRFIILKAILLFSKFFFYFGENSQ